MKECEIHIEANSQYKHYLRDFIDYRELFYFLAWRDIVVRYKQAFLGVAWSVIRPILNMIVFTFIFGKLAHLPSDHVNYAVFVLAGLLPWQLFANSSIDTCNSLTNNAQLITKTYFPRMIVPAAEIVVHLFDFAIATILLLLLSILTGSLNWATLPFIIPFSLLVITLCFSLSLWLSTLTVKYRDFRILIPFCIQFGLFVSPVGYGSAIIPEDLQWIYFLNPIAGIIDGFRYSFFGISHSYMLYSVTSSICFTLLTLFTGLRHFKKIEPTLTDLI